MLVLVDCEESRKPCKASWMSGRRIRKTRLNKKKFQLNKFDSCETSAVKGEKCLSCLNLFSSAWRAKKIETAFVFGHALIPPSIHQLRKRISSYPFRWLTRVNDYYTLRCSANRTTLLNIFAPPFRMRLRRSNHGNGISFIGLRR